MLAVKVERFYWVKYFFCEYLNTKKTVHVCMRPSEPNFLVKINSKIIISIVFGIRAGEIGIRDTIIWMVYLGLCISNYVEVG